MTLRRASTPQYGGALYVFYSSSAVLSACTLINSTATSSAGHTVSRSELAGGLGGCEGSEGRREGSRAAVSGRDGVAV